MEDFDRNFKKQSKEFDRDFKRVKIFSLISSIVIFLFSLGLVGFAVWVIIMLMRFFGVV